MTPYRRLDIEGTTEDLGKTAGIDITNQKSTYTSILGVTEAKRRLQKQYDIAMTSLQQIPLDTSDLEILCDYIVSRKK